MSTPYWFYFLSLEKDFIRTLDYLDLAPANAGAYSDNFAKLILATGSEVDVVSKALCSLLSPNSKAENISHYREIITSSYPQIHEAAIIVERTGTSIEPWASWAPQVSKRPSWWDAYNGIKHNRVQNIRHASQENALLALCGLLVMNRYYHFAAKTPGILMHPTPYPQMLDAGAPAYLVEAHGIRRLPGI